MGELAPERRQRPYVDTLLASARWSRHVAVLGTVLALALAWYAWLEFTRHERRLALDAAVRDQSNLIVAVSNYIARAMSNADALAQFLVKARAAPGTDLPAVLAERAAANELFSAIVLCEPGGRWASSGPPTSNADAQRWCDGWLASAPPASRTFPAPPVASARGNLVPLLTRVAAVDGRGEGVLALLVELPRLLGVLQEYSIPHETVVVVVGADGRPRARWHSVMRMADQHAPEAALLSAVRAGRELGQIHAVDGRSKIVSARQAGSYPLFVLVTTDVAETLEAPRQRSLYLLLVTAAATVLLPIFTVVVLRLQGRMVGDARALAAAQGELERLNAQLESDVRARTAQLERAYRDLETFSYSVAHDVRAPLGAISGFAEALQDTVAASGNPKAAHYLRRISANAAHMDGLTASLLALGKLSRAPLSLAEVDLAGVAGEVLAALREREGSERDVSVEIEGDLRVLADPVLMRQVMENLLGNAWKFTSRRPAARIAISGSRDAATQETTVRVRDNGEGFDAAAETDLFRPFQRMHAAGEFPGTGVGLATVERIVRRHGGRVWLESSSQHGTAVFFTLPRPG